MKRLILSVIVLLLSNPGFPALAKNQQQGDVGSQKCREVQLSVQASIVNGGPFKNHGQMVQAVTQLVNSAKKKGDITGECGSCILNQFAQRIPVSNQKPCGPDPVPVACCLPDGSCEEITKLMCINAGGVANETGSTCATIVCSYYYEISSDIKPQASSLPDPMGGPDLPVAAYADEKGVVTDFVANEVIISPRSEEELNLFLAENGGTVVGDDSVPQPPPELGITMPPEYAVPTEYTVRVTLFPDTTTFQSDSWLRGVRGFYRFSSEEAVKLMALATQASLSGMKVMPNWVYYGDDMLHETREMPLADGTNANPMGNRAVNGFIDPYLYNSNRSTIYKAWQFMAAAGFDQGQSVNLAILDGGFWLDGEGHPQQGSTDIGTDLPGTPVQYDFVGDDYVADGPNALSCTGGNPCPWHGNGSASVAAGFVDNMAADAGSGGQVARPFLFKTSTASTIRRAVRTLIPWGAQVANMSYGGECNEDCIEWCEENNYYLRFQEAINAGIVLVASAGNDGIDVDANRVEPCVIPGVICVGALESYINTAKGYSNYGASVDIWAPTDISAMPNGDHPDELISFGGTSASSPLVAGVAAMMKAINPALNSNDVAAMLHSSAWKIGVAESSDPKVQPAGYLDAYTAVLKAADWKIFDDIYEPNDTPETASQLFPVNYEDLTLNPGKWDYYRFTLNDYGTIAVNLEYMRPMGYISFTLTPETTSNAPGGVSQTSQPRGFNYSAAVVPPGTYRLLLSASTPQYYFMDFSKTETGLQPDQFEVNNSTATATALSTTAGSWELNFHQNTDVDYFLIEIPSLPFVKYQTFSIDNADVPVTIQRLDPVTYAVLETKTGQAIKFTFDYQESGNKYLMKISGSYGRYVLGYKTGSYDNPWGNILAFDPLWWIYDPSAPVVNPIKNILTEREDWLVFIPGSPFGAAGQLISRINLYAKGLSIRLYDENLNLIKEGLPAVGASIGMDVPMIPDETLDTTGILSSGSQYLLQLYRSVGADDPADGSVLVLPQMPYSVEAVF